MRRSVVITGLGTVTGLGIGIDTLWKGVCEGRSAVDRIASFDPSGFDVRIAAEVRDLNVRDFVPKHYRKATKVMARDIELAVAAAHQAVTDAALRTPGIDGEGDRSYPGPRMGAHIGAGLIAADLNELTAAMAGSVDEQGRFDIHKWGSAGMNDLTPLWLLKYLPNMLACHVTIIHDAQGPSNTITCAEASGGLSIGESLRVIQRGAADMCFCGGAESKINPMTFFRQNLIGHLNASDNDQPGRAARPFDESAGGTVVGECAGIITLEARQTAEQRGAKVYAELIGVGAGHTVYPEGGGLIPDPQGRGIAAAMRSALRDAGVTADAIDLIVPYGSAIPAYDRAEAVAMRSVFGDRLGDIPLWCSSPAIGKCGAGAGGVDVALAARMIAEKTIPARINCPNPIDGLNAGNSDMQPATLNHVMVTSTGLGGQNVALVLRRA